MVCRLLSNDKKRILNTIARLNIFAESQIHPFLFPCLDELTLPIQLDDKRVRATKAVVTIAAHPDDLEREGCEHINSKTRTDRSPGDPQTSPQAHHVRIHMHATEHDACRLSSI